MNTASPVTGFIGGYNREARSASYRELEDRIEKENERSMRPALPHAKLRYLPTLS